MFGSRECCYSRLLFNYCRDILYKTPRPWHGGTSFGFAENRSAMPGALLQGI